MRARVKARASAKGDIIPLCLLLLTLSICYMRVTLWPMNVRDFVLDCLLIVHLFLIKFNDCFDPEFHEKLVTKCKMWILYSQ